METPIEYIKKVCTLFKTYGIKSVTMDDVARELGISKKTLYLHFNDKLELVSLILDREFEEKAKEFDAAMANKDNAIEEVFGYFKVQLSLLASHKPNFLYDLKKYYPLLYENFSEKKKNRMMESVLSNMKRGKKEGLYRKDLNEEVITRMHIARIESIMISGMFTIEELISPEFFSQAFKYHLYGIVSKKGWEIVNSSIDKIIENA